MQRHNDEERADFDYNEGFGLIIAFIVLFIPWIVGAITIIITGYHFIKSFL